MKQFEISHDLELTTKPLLKSAFVIKKGAYEKLVCRGCAEHLMDLAYTAYTPVTLSCEAFCSICDEAI
jgi:hypothetical protein